MSWRLLKYSILLSILIFSSVVLAQIRPGTIRTTAYTRSLLYPNADANDVLEDLMGSIDLMWIPGGVTAEKYIHGSTTVTAAGPTDNLDVNEIDCVFLDTSSNNVTIGGLVNGRLGQLLYVAVTDSTNDAVLEHAEATGNQDVYLSSSADETVYAGDYGGWLLVCDGTSWFEASAQISPSSLADGNAVGDLYWWDGSAWDFLDANEPNDVLTLNDSNEPVWKTQREYRTFNIQDPDSVYSNDPNVCMIPLGFDVPVTITRFQGTCNKDPTNELDLDLYFADAFIGKANATLIGAVDTTSGTVNTTSFSDATVPAGKTIYLIIQADPDDDITQFSGELEFKRD